jgi:hypothetical protein
MDPALRRAWTQIVAPDHYDSHMSAIGQAQAATTLTAFLINAAQLPAASRITIAGAGTGQLLDFLDPEILRPHRLIYSDINPNFLARLRDRLAAHNLDGNILLDDIERTALPPRPQLLIATLLLEHVDLQLALASIAQLKPRALGIILQENPPEMTTAVTPGRQLPPSIAKAVEAGANPTLIPRDQLISALASHNYSLRSSHSADVADSKRLLALLFTTN